MKNPKIMSVWLLPYYIEIYDQFYRLQSYKAHPTFSLDINGCITQGIEL